VLVAEKRIHVGRSTIRDSYCALLAENAPVNADLADTSHRDAIPVAATIANQLQMDRRDAVGWLAICSTSSKRRGLTEYKNLGVTAAYG
jgi:hypothetical protein